MTVPTFVWYLIILVAIFAVIVLVGGSCSIGDHSIVAN